MAGQEKPKRRRTRSTPPASTPETPPPEAVSEQSKAAGAAPSPGEDHVQPETVAAAAAPKAGTQHAASSSQQTVSSFRHAPITPDLAAITNMSELIPVMVELNLRYVTGLSGAEQRFRELFRQVLGDAATQRKLELVANSYMVCRLSKTEWSELLRRDRRADDGSFIAPNERSIYRIWKDYEVEMLMDESVITVKGDAARRTFAAAGQGIVWAVVDSGIDAKHPHFEPNQTLLGDPVKGLHRDFTIQSDIHEKDEDIIQQSITSALTDAAGHGTHVAGIIGGTLASTCSKEKFRVLQLDTSMVDGDDVPLQRLEDLPVDNPARMSSVAPECKLVSLKVLPEQGKPSTSTVMKALQYVREEINGNGKELIIHGVNLSLGYEFDAELFACGQSPICVEVDKLVRSGVVVVVAAGNTGYGKLQTQEGFSRTGMSLTINDPGNAALAITVGSTHRNMPHTYGVSYFSSKGPTGDDRLKPDLVAPGERIISCGAGKALADLLAPDQPADGIA
ncbi:MAG TPA: S8 family serine peptidase, partial [Herpetosiphonaceae bacterium]|nr:S8 family serine peptidase [Herpetosiphonaceae bacterium]